MDIQSNNKNQRELLLYKLLNDVLVLWLLVFAGMLLAEGLVPGFFSARLSFTKIILVLFAILFSIIWLGKRRDIAFDKLDERKFFKNKMILLLLAISFIMIFNSLRNLGLARTAISSLAVFCILLFFLKTFLFPGKK